MTKIQIITAALLVIGDEILSGRTKDRNIGTVAEKLCSIGIDLKEVRVVGDDESAIVDAVRELKNRYTYLFTTGGIGPTHDDITVDSIGKALRLPVAIDPRAEEMMRRSFEARNLELTPVRLRMARMPKGAELVVAANSGAPGFQIQNIIVMAGVPSIMEAMLVAATDRLMTGAKFGSCSIVLHRPESDIAELLAAHQAAYPDVAMGSYPAFVEGQYRTELVLRGREPALLDEAYQALLDALKRHGLDT